MTKTAKILESIRKKHGGLLRPQDVVEYARPTDSPLHDQFEWDDSKAADEYRLWQARQLIRVTVTVLPNTVTPIRTYVSLTPDRSAGGGYRRIADVVKKPDLYEQALADALKDLERIQQKYKQLAELGPVFEAVKKVRKPKLNAAG